MLRGGGVNSYLVGFGEDSVQQQSCHKSGGLRQLFPANQRAPNGADISRLAKKCRAFLGQGTRCHAQGTACGRRMRGTERRRQREERVRDKTREKRGALLRSINLAGRSHSTSARSRWGELSCSRGERASRSREGVHRDQRLHVKRRGN